MPGQPLLLNCSDAHLRSKRSDEQYAFSQIIDRALADNLSIVDNGDFFDRQTNRAEVVTFAYRQLDRLSEGQLFYYVLGQHDADTPPWLSAHDRAIHLHKQQIEFAPGIVLYGLDWQPFGKLQEELAQIPETATVLVCHQVWGNWMGDRASPQGDFVQIPEHIKYVFTGDLHAWKLERHKNAGGELMTVLSTGATTQQKVNEPDTHHYAVVLLDGTELKFQKATLRSRVFVPCGTLVSDEDVTKFLGAIEVQLASAAHQAALRDLPPELQKPVFRYEVSAQLETAIPRIERALAGRAVVSIKQLIPEERLESYAKAEIKDGDAVTPRAVLGEVVNKDEQPLVYTLCERLLVAAEADRDIEAEFAQWRTEQLAEEE